MRAAEDFYPGAVARNSRYLAVAFPKQASGKPDAGFDLLSHVKIVLVLVFSFWPSVSSPPAVALSGFQFPLREGFVTSFWNGRNNGELYHELHGIDKQKST